jgi:hypothetical protein
MGAADFELAHLEMKTLSEASAVELPYPYEMVWRVSSRGVKRVDEDSSCPLFPSQKAKVM